MQVQKQIAGEILANRECYSLKCLSVNGEDLIQKGIREGKEIGTILKALLFGVIMEKLPNEKEALLKRAEMLHKKKKDAGDGFD